MLPSHPKKLILKSKNEFDFILGGEETGGWGTLRVGEMTGTVRYNIIKVRVTRKMKGGECSTHRRNAKCMQIFHWETLDGKYNFADIRCMVG